MIPIDRKLIETLEKRPQKLTRQEAAFLADYIRRLEARVRELELRESARRPVPGDYRTEQPF